mgnify:CR=1 FL=1
MAHSKRYNNNSEKIDHEKEYSLKDAAELLAGFSKPKFDESIEMAINLGVDPKHADQIVRGTVTLPNGIGKDIKVLVFAKDNLAEEAKNAGADNPKTLLNVVESTGDQSAAVAFIDIKINNFIC